MSIAKAQAKLLTDSVLESIGVDKSNYTEPSNDVMSRHVLMFIDEAQSIINKNGRVSKGNLSDLEFDIEKKGKRIEANIGYAPTNPARRYYYYMNSGVNGVNVKHGAPYSFKTLGVSESFLNNLKSWKGFNIRANRNEDQKKNKSSLQKKRKRITNSKDASLYALAISIKKNGIKPIHFLDKAAKKTFNKNFELELQEEIGEAISISIFNEFNKNNNGSKSNK